MTDVFISYSRRDKVFTQKLVDALQAANREVWADWASIPAASDWDAEIKEGIEKTNTVLFVLSPEWLKSNECRKELLHALQMGKKLIPILHIMPDQGQEVPPELAKINWVYMRETDNFDKAFETLQSAMDTDLDWIKVHTRIQVRAIEWNKKNRDNSLTLRGNDLSEGEQFMSQGSGKSPEPTSLQGEFIFASRKDATRRQRITLAGVTIALVISVALGIVAYFQRQAAVLNSKIALARELTASARTSLETDPEQSILLALQASQITIDAGQGILSSTEDILRDSIQTSRLRYKVTISDDQILSIAFSPNGEFLATGTQNGKIIIWKIYNIPNHVEKSNSFPETIWLESYSTLSNEGTPVESVVFSPDSKLLATSSDGTGLPAVWDIAAQKKIFNLQGDLGYIWNIVYSPDGQSLATAGEDGIVRLWNVNGAPILNIDSHGHYRVTGLAFSPDGKTIISAGESGQLVISDTSTGAIIDTYTDDSVLVYLAYNPKGNQIAFGNSSYNVKILDLNTNEVLNTKHHKDRAAKLAFSPDGSMLASAGIDSTTYVIDPNTGNIIFSLVGDTNDIFDVTFSPDGQYIATGNADGEIKFWDGSIIPPSEAGTITTQSEPGTGLAFSSDGTKLVTSADEPAGHLYDFTTSDLTTLYSEPIWINDVAISPDQKLIANGRENGSIVIWDATTGKIINEASSAEGQIPYDVEYSPDGKNLLSGAGSVDIWDAEAKELLSRTIPGEGDVIWAATFNPDGTLIAAGGTKGVVTLIDSKSGEIVKSLTGHLPDTAIRSVSFSPDGTKILSGSFDNTAIIWDVETGSMLHALTGHQGGVTNVAFSPDGARAVTSSSDGSVKIWDVTTGENLFTLVANKYYQYFWVNNVAYTPDGKLLATLSEDGTTRFYYTNVEDVLALARSRITRSLTEDECQLFLHVDTCPSTIVQPTQPSNKMAGMIPLVPMEKVAEIGKSNSDLRSEFSDKQVTLEIRNKTVQSLQVFWITTDFVENNVRNLAPSEYTRIQVNDKTAFRVRDLQGKIVFEYIATNDEYQQLNLTSTAPLKSENINSGNNTNPENQQEKAATPNLRTLQGTVQVNLRVVNFTDDSINVVYIDGNGFENLFGTLDSGGAMDIDTWELQAWRLRSANGNLLYEYVTDKSPDQIVTIDMNLNSDVEKQDLNGNQLEFAATTVGLKSGEGSTEVLFKITNNASTAISMTWMDFNGTENAFYTFNPGESIEQGTFETHAWRIRDKDGNLLFEYVATAQPIQEITINSDLTVSVK